MLIWSIMDRRSFLKSIGATALLPALPIPAGSLAAQSSVAAGTAAFSQHTYQWAEMIVRAHNKCNLGLLQRSLQVDATAASALKQALIKNGIVHAQANAYGIHTATKPLYEGAFMSVSEASEKVIEAAEEISDFIEDTAEPTEKIQEIDHENNKLSAEPESNPEPDQALDEGQEENKTSFIDDENQDTDTRET